MLFYLQNKMGMSWRWVVLLELKVGGWSFEDSSEFGANSLQSCYGIYVNSENNQTRVAIEECRWSPIACWYVLQGKFGCQGIAEQWLLKKENCIIEYGMVLGVVCDSRSKLIAIIYKCSSIICFMIWCHTNIFHGYDEQRSILTLLLSIDVEGISRQAILLFLDKLCWSCLSLIEVLIIIYIYFSEP